MEIDRTTKLAAVRHVLLQRGVKLQDHVEVKDLGLVIPMYIPKYNISVFCDESADIYPDVRGYTHPVFIRDADTADFVLEKITNTMYSPPGRIFRSREKRFKAMLAPPSSSPEKRKRKRFTVVHTAVSVTSSGKPRMGPAGD